ncbi:MAG: protocatechuate 3,4-dioxygenase [Rhodospirillaceae bacterium]|nr:protocatechuate 3,4-dioxygenase [Rhodospirillaceae bacterium]
MSWRRHDYDDLPGTYVFDGSTAHRAYGLNKLLFSFNHEQNRQAFEDDPEGYADRFDLNSEQRDALFDADFLTLLRLGANIYYVAKLAVPRGMTMQDTGAAFQGITRDEFQANLDAKAEGLEEKLRKAGGFWHG